ncbi:MAG: hypothetical protein K2W81_00630 [Sphingomonas sp.]|uniref:hypothetical protein n=1 Tax=Sphingomonas sp. TaxID=28214 RepID=UPI0025D94BEA|nr:hypothetical protein [Sphingomonas sp.]MBY0282447.1 hypothetical protein [Sphingomonas sp.]
MSIDQSSEKAEAIGMLVASAIVALWLVVFWQGYQFGRDLAKAHFARQSQEVTRNQR